MLRSIKPEEFLSTKDNAAAVLDIRRGDDYSASEEIIPGATWYDPVKIDEWLGAVPKEGQVVVYCVRGGGVSNSIIDRLHADGINAQYIEGGIEGLKDAGGAVEKK